MAKTFEDRLGFHIKRAEQELIAAKTAALKPVGLTVPQHSALLVLEEEPGISGAELARRCLVTPQTMTTILRNLEAAGLIERTPHPRHRHVIETRPTEAGRTALASAEEPTNAIERRLAASFTSAELVSLRELLDRCSTVLAAERAPR